MSNQNGASAVRDQATSNFPALEPEQQRWEQNAESRRLGGFERFFKVAVRLVDDRHMLDRSERGAALAEAALVFPLLMLLLLATFTGGIVLDRRASVHQAAREGARYGATVPAAQCKHVSDPCSGQTWAQVVQAGTVSRSNGEATTATTCVALVEGPGSAPAVVNGEAHYSTNGVSPCFVDNSAEKGRRVQVRVTATGEINVVLSQIPVNIAAEMAAKFEE